MQEKILTIAQFVNPGSEIIRDTDKVPYALGFADGNRANWSEFEYTTSWSALHFAYGKALQAFKERGVDIPNSFHCLQFSYHCMHDNIEKAFSPVYSMIIYLTTNQFKLQA